MAVQNFLRDLDGLFNYSTDENPTSQQDYQEAVKNWVDTIKSLVDCTLWQPDTEYSVGNVLRTPSLPYELHLTCITAGTSGSAEPDYTDVEAGDVITDGTVIWAVDKWLPLSGGTMKGNIAWTKGEIGFRGTTHTDPTEVCKQVVVTAGTIDSAWIDGNAKLCLHTHDSTETNTAENGSFVLQADDGTDAPFLEGKPDGSLKWATKEVERITSKLDSTSSTGYIRYENGLQICWGTCGNVNTSGYVQTVYPVPFKITPTAIPCSRPADKGAGSGRFVSYCASDATPTSGYFSILYTNGGAATTAIYYIAIGFWK